MLWCDVATFWQGDYALSADLRIEAERVTAVIGPSGAGKSTLLGGIAGFHRQQHGRLMWKEVDITAFPPEKRPVSMLFQDNNLFPHLTVTQNVGLAVTPRLRLSAEERLKVAGILMRVGLEGLGDRKPAALSGGQQSRAALARALLQDREIMLMDEPFSALGPGLKAEMLDLSVALARDAGRTVVMVTHDPADAARVADAIIGVVPNVAWPPIDTKQFLSDPPNVFKSYLG
jgi:thiamine transport system ATP-binding protein